MVTAAARDTLGTRLVCRVWITARLAGLVVQHTTATTRSSSISRFAAMTAFVGSLSPSVATYWTRTGPFGPGTSPNSSW